jgi:hypothetical protein
MPYCAIADQKEILDGMEVREDEVREATWERRKGGVRAVALFLDVDHLGQVMMSSSLCYSAAIHLKKYVMTSVTETQMEMTRRGQAGLHEERADWVMRREAGIWTD